jgi:hypothetical protein
MVVNAENFLPNDDAAARLTGRVGSPGTQGAALSEIQAD